MRTLCSALLNPTESRTILERSQEGRKLYFLLRISYILTLSYLNIKLIMADTLQRRIETGKHDFECVDPDDFIALRKLAMKRRKPCLGRIMHEYLKTTVDRLHRKLWRSKFTYIDLKFKRDSIDDDHQAEGEEPIISSLRDSRASSLFSISKMSLEPNENKNEV